MVLNKMVMLWEEKQMLMYMLKLFSIWCREFA